MATVHSTVRSKTCKSRTLVWLSSCINSMLYLCMGGFKKRLKESMKKKLARISRSEAENRNSTIPTARETLLDNTVTNGSRANSLRYVHLSCIEHFTKQLFQYDTRIDKISDSRKLKIRKRSMCAMTTKAASSCLLSDCHAKKPNDVLNNGKSLYMRHMI